MSDQPDLYPVPSEWAQRARMNAGAYEAARTAARETPDAFWSEQARRLDWFTAPSRIKDVSFDKADFRIRWFEDGVLNVAHNCLDRHLETRGDETAIIWEGDDPNQSGKLSYRELHREVCRMANVLKGLGVVKGDRVTLYLPMIPAAAVAMLACARIGAVHSVVFGGFSPDSLCGRIEDCGSKVVITADEGLRGGKRVPLKANVDAALQKGAGALVEKVLIVSHTNADIPIVEGRDVRYGEAKHGASDECPCEPMKAEDPLFILYTSGSTGKPKGVLHTTGGYLFWAAWTHELVFDYRPGEVFWCTADVGWVTGHTYVAYGPLAVGATQVVFEGVPTYPNAGRFWDMIARHRVTIFYTAPTAIRSLIKACDTDPSTHPKHYDLSSLRLMGSVGEPINPEAWMWYHTNVGGGRCPIVDTFWQTETGGHAITPLPGATPLVPGSCTLPLPGIAAAIVDESGGDLPNGTGGILVIKKPWPSMIRTIWGDPERFKKSYFPPELKGYYLAGDGAVRNKDTGYFTITGHIDDVLNVSGHRMGTMEIESALVSHPLVAESAVVGRPDDLTGEAIVAFVVLKGARPADAAAAAKVAKELRDWVGREIGPIAKPKDIRFGDNLPKTRSGKIMRRLLRSIARGDEITQDTSTLENPAILEQLKQSL